MGDTKEPVVFKLGDTGEEASNDPRWLAEQMKKQIKAQEATDGRLAGGQGAENIASMNQAELKAKVKELKSQGVEVDTKGVKKVADLRARVAAAVMSQNGGDEDLDTDDDDEE